MLFLYVAKYDLGWEKLSWPAVSLISDMQGHPNCIKEAHGLFTAILLRSVHRVRTLFWTKTSRTLQGLSRTHFAFFKDSIQCKKEIWVYVFFSSTTTWAILSWRSFILGTWESGLDIVSTEIQGLSSTDYNFQGLSRPWTFYFKFQGLSRTFKVRANPGSLRSRAVACCGVYFDGFPWNLHWWTFANKNKILIAFCSMGWWILLTAVTHPLLHLEVGTLYKYG